MASLTNMKSHLTELENQKIKLEADIRNANQRLRMSLLGFGAGVILLRLSLWLGIAVIAIAGILAIFYFVKQTSIHDKLENLESEIHKLEISMV